MSSAESDWAQVKPKARKDNTPDTPETPLSKAQLKNKKRADRRRERSDSQENLCSASYEPQYGTPRAERRRANSKGNLSSDEDEDEEGSGVPRRGGLSAEDDADARALAELHRKLRGLAKRLKAVEAAEAKVAKQTSLAKEDAHLAAKLSRRATLEVELVAAQLDVADIEDRCAARRAAHAAYLAERARVRDAEANLMLAVQFDERWACPICTEIVEAVVSVPSACAHIFCRGCLEDHIALARKPSECCCPMCRAPFCDRKGRVDAKPEAKVRARIRQEVGRCHCGLEVRLSELREHLRGCGPNASLYPPKRKFGHEFKQSTLYCDLPTPRLGAGNFAKNALEEERQLQAAILLSVNDWR